ncbi:MAG: glycerophosphodiester phosphodiesterase [Pseudomonadota bacterium]|nr:glycerophosphodiester phosphodiesterase [Pseudomonadota bacterium]
MVHLRLTQALTLATLAAATSTALAGGADRLELADRLEGKIVIAHRGASGYLPEHTLEAYALAYGMGADYIEPDLVMTHDGVLIALHDIHLEGTTDVEAVFPDRAREDGRWYAADFTLAEIKQLSVEEREDGANGARVFPQRFPDDAEGFTVPTFEEMIRLVQGLNAVTGCDVGIYPETKLPAFHDAEGLAMEQTLLTTLAEYGYRGRDARVFVQSFDPANLQEMRFELGTDLPLVQLISGGQQELTEPAALRRIATYADGIGPSKTLIEDSAGALVAAAHALDLLVHPYTFRADALPGQYQSLRQELAQFYFGYGVDGLFTDQPNLAVDYLKLRQPARRLAERRRCSR